MSATSLPCIIFSVHDVVHCFRAASKWTEARKLFIKVGQIWEITHYRWFICWSECRMSSGAGISMHTLRFLSDKPAVLSAHSRWCISNSIFAYQSSFLPFKYPICQREANIWLWLKPRMRNLELIHTLLSLNDRGNQGGNQSQIDKWTERIARVNNNSGCNISHKSYEIKESFLCTLMFSFFLLLSRFSWLRFIARSDSYRKEQGPLRINK